MGADTAQNQAEDPVLFEKQACQEGALGLITLNNARKFNALTLPMIEAIQQQLDAWAEDDDVRVIVLCGNGEKAFCAGGDVRSVHEAIQNAKGRPGNDGERFFAAEYRMDYTIATHPKPVVCWGQGVVMGGGLGMMNAARYRLVTPDLKMGMPEISIGFFPDVGASRFLNRLPGSIGMFMGLTGATLNVADSLRVSLADYAVPNDGFDQLMEQLRDQNWTRSPETNDRHLLETLQSFAAGYQLDLSESNLERHEQFISRICRGRDVVAVVNAILNTEAESEWFQAAQNNLRNGCPVSAHIVFEQLHRGLQQSLRDIFMMELIVAVHCARHRDFLEGVRARLIDKDHEPRWTHKDVASVPAGWIRSHFTSPWPEGEHPLQDL